MRDKVVIITGGSAGIGAAAARYFAQRGAKLVLVGRRPEPLQQLAEELATETEVLALALDVADRSQWAALFEQSMARFGRIDVLVNNAGLHRRGDVANNDCGDLVQMMDVNLTAPIALSRLVIPYLRQSGGGAIVNVASLAGFTPIQGAATYAAGKAGLRAFSYSLADELRDEGIHVGLVCPGPVDTGFIMNEISDVEGIVFAQPMSSAEQVAAMVYRVAQGEMVEAALPRVSALLATVGYLFPAIRRKLRPAMNRKGERNKQKYLARAAQQ